MCVQPLEMCTAIEILYNHWNFVQPLKMCTAIENVYNHWNFVQPLNWRVYKCKSKSNSNHIMYKMKNPKYNINHKTCMIVLLYLNLESWVCMKNTSNLSRKQSKSGHSRQGELGLTSLFRLRCSHISQFKIDNISWNQICISFSMYILLIANWYKSLHNKYNLYGSYTTESGLPHVPGSLNVRIA